MVYSVGLLSERDFMNALIFADIYVLVITSLLSVLHGIVYSVLFTVYIVSHRIDIHIMNINYSPSSYQSRRAPSTDGALNLR